MKGITIEFMIGKIFFTAFVEQCPAVGSCSVKNEESTIFDQRFVFTFIEAIAENRSTISTPSLI